VRATLCEWLVPVATQSETVSVEETIIALLVLAAVVSVVTKFLRLPYTVTLVLAGLVVGLTGVLKDLQFSADLVFFVFLPVILFEAALNTPAAYLKRYWPVIALLATFGVLVSFALTTAGLRLLTDEPLAEIMLFAALIAATDPVSVVTLFRRLKADRRLTTVVDSESLFNDGTAAVVFAITLLVLREPGTVGIDDAVLRFLWMAGGGLAIGAAIGYVASRLHRLFDEQLLELMMTTIVAYGSFLVGELLGMSGPVACAAAGIVVGNVGRELGMSDGVKQAVTLFWEYAAFIVNSLVFLLIGAQMDLDAIGGNIGLVMLGFAIVLISRAAAVYSSAGIGRLLCPSLPGRWQHVLVWGGLRGTVALALALSVPADTPGQERLVTLTFGVVLCSLLVQGLTMKPFAHAMGVGKTAGGRRSESPSGPGGPPATG
jgi:CPA1 family monovalent cation:H+ antiporter